ncbi:hypothetical protein RHSIM_Rhsim02G0203900 [Rhododendron simsii]|uniref:Pentatricopeptide repeat-containing protein n=1 Tax=Rhododendron simsii TaxID=118357 RepID=A0A834HEP3_RHOSS|nr:hypothetical protein RHSIM_Rhsim02G0203900 [Rhododendron simsii]
MLGRVGSVVEAYEFVKELGEEGNNFRILGSLLGACRNHGEFELGKNVSNKLLQMERGKGLSGCHVLLSNIYAEEGNWEYVYRVRKGMREKGLTKDVGCSWVDVAGCVNSFVSRDQSTLVLHSVVHCELSRDLCSDSCLVWGEFGVTGEYGQVFYLEE